MVHQPQQPEAAHAGARGILPGSPDAVHQPLRRRPAEDREVPGARLADETGEDRDSSADASQQQASLHREDTGAAAGAATSHGKAYPECAQYGDAATGVRQPRWPREVETRPPS